MLKLLTFYVFKDRVFNVIYFFLDLIQKQVWSGTVKQTWHFSGFTRKLNHLITTFVSGLENTTVVHAQDLKQTSIFKYQMRSHWSNSWVSPQTQISTGVKKALSIFSFISNAFFSSKIYTAKGCE